MRKILFVAMFFLGSSIYANELDDFKRLLNFAQQNYKRALTTSSSEQKRDYVKNLNELKRCGNIITKRLIPYKKYYQIDDMKILPCCNRLISLYNSARLKPADAVRLASGGGKSGRVGADITSLQSTSEMEADRRGCYFLLHTWARELDELGYPNIKIPTLPVAVEYSNLLNKFKLCAKGLVGQYENSRTSKAAKKRQNKKKVAKISSLVRAYIKHLFKRFSDVARKLQKSGMKQGFSISKYVGKVNAYINETDRGNNIISKSSDAECEIIDDYEYSLSKLEEFGQLLASSSSLEDEKVKARVLQHRCISDGMSTQEMFEKLREYRKKIIENDMSTAGLTYDPQTIREYIKSLSKDEYLKYKKAAKQYISKGYDIERAKTTAIKQIHSYVLARRFIISKSELKSILDRLGLQCPSPDDSPIVDGNISENNKRAENDALLNKLKRIRVAILGRNTHLSGRAIDGHTASKYEKTLSKREKSKYTKLRKQYTEQGYGDKEAKSSAIIHLHTLLMSGLTRIDTKELEKILGNIKKLSKKVSE